MTTVPLSVRLVERQRAINRQRGLDEWSDPTTAEAVRHALLTRDTPPNGSDIDSDAKVMSAPPVKFYGKAHQLQTLINLCKVEFASATTPYLSEETQAAYFAKAFQGDALAWLDTYLTNKGTLGTYQSLKSATLAQFGIPDYQVKEQARKKLEKLHQTGPAPQYINSLELLFGQLGITDDETRNHHLVRGLKSHIKNAVVSQQDEEDSYHTVKRDTIRIDAALYATYQPKAFTPKGQKQIKCFKCGRYGHKKSACKSTGSAE